MYFNHIYFLTHLLPDPSSCTHTILGSLFKKKILGVQFALSQLLLGVSPAPSIYQRSQLPYPHTVWDPKLQLGK